ncbi:MAG: DUF1186 domain-containing protein [Bacteroidetes bacterium]|nr:DUF1186 domain-containing protein [Bacteroidota bacterium]
MNKVSLTHPQLYSLYSNGMRIDRKIIEEILELPRETLVNDLEAIVKASIDNYDYYKSQNLSLSKRSFPIHAFFILSELKSESSLYTVLAFLSQSKDALEFWCGKYTKELLWEVVYNLGSNSLEFLKKYILNGINNIETNRAILKAVSQIAVHQPRRRDEVIKWYKEIIYYIMQARYDDYHYPFALTGTVVSGILDFKGVELFNEVRILYDMNKVNKLICGDMEDFTTELRTELQRDFKSRLYNIYERYEFILNDREYYYKMEDLKELKEDSKKKTNQHQKN